MNLLLVHPSPLMYTKIYLRLEPLGLELVAAAARHAGHTVTLIDLQVESHQHFVRLLHECRPDAIGFSCNYLANVPEVVDLAKLAKQLSRTPSSSSAAIAPRSSRVLSSIMPTAPSIVS
jgi:hypothetical protein